MHKPVKKYSITASKGTIVMFMINLACILAYGQTSSGKTHTMKGTRENPGLIPMCLVDMFTRIE